MNDKKVGRHRILVLLTLLAASIYIIWRIFFTLPLHYGIVSLIAGLALVVAETIGVLEAIEHYLNMSSNTSIPMPLIPDEWYPDVDVLISTHNESADLLYKTINGCNHMRYPDLSKVHIFLCDDMNRPEVAKLAANLKIGYFGLSDNKHAKAGNLNHALRQTHSPLVATFDADMIPTDNFLLETVPYFFLPLMTRNKEGRWVKKTVASNEEIGFIQTPQSFYNLDLFQYNLYSEASVPNEQDYFFKEVNTGRNRTNSPIYAGSNTLISRQALVEIGYMSENSITEDFATGIEIQKKGYRCYAINKTLAHGLTPTGIPDLIKQRERWGRGCVQTIRLIPFFFSKLPLKTKFSYLSSLMYWWTFLRRFIYIISPILFTVFGIRIVETNLFELALFWLPYYLLYNRTLRIISGNIRNQRWSNIIDTIIFPYMIVPIFLESFGIRQKKFVVTQKTKNLQAESNFRYAIPHFILAAATIIGFVICLNEMIFKHAYANIILIFWLLLNLYFLTMAIFFMRGRSNFRQEERLDVEIDIVIDFHGNQNKIIGKTENLSQSGIAFTLDFPDYIPYGKPLEIHLSSDFYQADLTGEIITVYSIGDKWKYGIRILEISEKAKKDYLQMIFDRQPILPSVITSKVIEELKFNLRAKKSSPHLSNRLLPRVKLDQKVQTDEGSFVIIEDFNYEYLRLAPLKNIRKELILLLEDDLQIQCDLVIENNSNLYKIRNYQELAMNSKFKNLLSTWILK